LQEFIEALELSLDKVPISDFEGVCEHDLGRKQVGIKSGKTFVRTLMNDAFGEYRKNKTWSYSIMGSNEASNLDCDFLAIKNSYFTPEEDKKYPRKVPRNIEKVLIERSFNQLAAHAYKKSSRLAFMVLGCFLMRYESKITEELRQFNLKYSDWKYEKNQLKNKKDRKERKKFLDDFREKIKNYDGTKVVILPSYYVTTPIWRQNIDYSIVD